MFIFNHRTVNTFPMNVVSAFEKLLQVSYAYIREEYHSHLYNYALPNYTPIVSVITNHCRRPNTYVPFLGIRHMAKSREKGTRHKLIATWKRNIPGRHYIKT